MSRTGRLTHDVIAVLDEIQRRYDGGRSGRRLSDLRRKSTEIIAKRTGRTVTTLHDVLARRLALSAGQFDHLLEDWLLRDSPGLCDRLIEKAPKEADRAEIHRFFNSTLPVDPPQALLPQPKPQKLSVELEEDVAQVFRDSKAVNEALRAIIRVARLASRVESNWIA